MVHKYECITVIDPLQYKMNWKQTGTKICGGSSRHIQSTTIEKAREERKSARERKLAAGEKVFLRWRRKKKSFRWSNEPQVDRDESLLLLGIDLLICAREPKVEGLLFSEGKTFSSPLCESVNWRAEDEALPVRACVRACVSPANRVTTDGGQTLSAPHSEMGSPSFLLFNWRQTMQRDIRGWRGTTISAALQGCTHYLWEGVFGHEMGLADFCRGGIYVKYRL